MATQQRSRNRRSSRDRAPRYVAPVLDPTWHNPYTPSVEERQANLDAVRTYALRRKRPQMVAIGVVVLALLAASFVAVWLVAVAVVAAALYAYDLRRSLASAQRSSAGLGDALLHEFEPGGSALERRRLTTVLDRLTATFGVDGISAFIIDDEGYNAALAPNGPALALFVTNALMRDFELIELEGVVAHLLARHRLGLLARHSAAAIVNANAEQRARLAGVGSTYRADEVAAAAIRFPGGLAGALHRCARQSVPGNSFFSSTRYDEWRWIFFDVHADRVTSDLSDLDDAELRALALEEW